MNYCGFRTRGLDTCYSDLTACLFLFYCSDYGPWVAIKLTVASVSKIMALRLRVEDSRSGCWLLARGVMRL